MHSSKQHFMFGMPVGDLVSKISEHPVHFFAHTTDGVMLMANDMQAELLKISSVNAITGKCIFELMRRVNIKAKEMKAVMLHNINTIDENMPKLFYETVAGKECLCVKSPLLDYSGRIIGVGGIAFFFHQTTFKDIVTLTNELFYLNPLNNIKN